MIQECIECGAQFEVELINAEDTDRVAYCPVCGEQLEDDLDENFYQTDEL